MILDNDVAKLLYLLVKSSEDFKMDGHFVFSSIIQSDIVVMLAFHSLGVCVILPICNDCFLSTEVVSGSCFLEQLMVFLVIKETCLFNSCYFDLKLQCLTF